MNKPLAFSQQDVDILKREVMYQGVFTLARFHVRMRTFGNGWSEPYTRELLERKSAVAVLPYDPILDRIILIEQFRIGALADPKSPWLLEVVAGIYDGDESPSEVATRETEEEAGCKLLDLHPICDYFVSPGGSNEHLTLFCGRIDASDAGGIYGLAEENEDIRALTLTVDEGVAMLREGKIKTSPAIIALQWLQLNREWLKQLWQKK